MNYQLGIRTKRHKLEDDAIRISSSQQSFQDNDVEYDKTFSLIVEGAEYTSERVAKLKKAYNFITKNKAELVPVIIEMFSAVEGKYITICEIEAKHVEFNTSTEGILKSVLTIRGN